MITVLLALLTPSVVSYLVTAALVPGVAALLGLVFKHNADKASKAESILTFCAQLAFSATNELAKKHPGLDKVSTALGVFANAMAQHGQPADEVSLEKAKALFAALHGDSAAPVTK